MKVLRIIKKQNVNIDKILDIGCGFGGLLKLTGEYLGATELYGIDIDEKAVAVAKERGINAIVLDAEREKFPYPSEYFDLVMSYGVWDYFTYWDDIILEVQRVLKIGGYVVISLPNLVSWHNRLALLLGYQPRDIEVSKRYLCGVHPFYKKRKEQCVGHIHTITALGFKELMECYGFKTIAIGKVNTITSKTNQLLRLANYLLQFLLSVNLSKRFIYLGRKESSGFKSETETSWWQKILLEQRKKTPE